MPDIHYDYKILTESSCPSPEELQAFFSSRKYSIWKDYYYYTYTLPTTKLLVNQAHTRFQEQITKHLNQGWKLQGSIFVSLKETKVYRLESGKIHSYDIISYSQALIKEESQEDYLKRTHENKKEGAPQLELEDVKQQILEIQTKLQTLCQKETNAEQTNN